MENVNLEELYKKGLKMHHITNTAYPLTPTSLMSYRKDKTIIKRRYIKIR